MDQVQTDNIHDYIIRQESNNTVIDNVADYYFNPWDKTITTECLNIIFIKI